MASSIALRSCRIYTPTDLADAMVQALGDLPEALWLEPCHGRGVFIDAISRLSVPKSRITAIDLDRTASKSDDLATTFRGIDFLRWSRETNQRFDRIVGNPPFISIKRLPKSLQKTAASILNLNGHPIGKAANVWYAFALASIRLLKQDGCLALILPSAAEFADYSVAIRNAMNDTFGKLELYRCERPLFESVQEGTLVAIASEYGAPPCRVSRKRFKSREDLIKGLSQSGSRNGHRCPSNAVRPAVSMVALSEVADIRLGGVTGDASFFLMNEDRRQSLELPLAAIAPVVSKAKHLRSPFLNQKEWENLKASGQRIWLFNPSEKIARHPKVKQYLKLTDSKGGCNRKAYKVTVREPWYRTPMPKSPHAFLSGMNNFGPWLCMNEMNHLNATNTLYVVTFRSQNREVWYMWALALLTSIVQRQIRRIGRLYADGLVKYEPGPLGKIRLPRLKPDMDYKERYVLAIKALLKEDRKEARNIADAAVLSS